MRAGAAGRRSHIITHGRCIPNMYLHVVADPVVMCVCVYGPLTLGVSCVDECSGRLLFYLLLLLLLRLVLLLLLLLLQYNCPALDLSPLRIIVYLHTCLSFFTPIEELTCPVLSIDLT